MPHADYTLQAAWEGQNLGQFVIDFSTLDGTDTFGASFAADFTGSYDDLTGYLKQASWTYGRTGGTGQPTQGTGTLILNDETGLFNPSNPASPLAGSLKPMRPIRMTSSFEGTTRGCFYHFIDSIEHNPDPNVKETTITTFDLFEWLTRFSPTYASAGLTTVGAAVGHVLDAVYWTEPAMRSLGNGDDISEPAADGTRTALQLILEDLLATDPGGMFFIDGPNGPGRATYKSRHDLLLDASSATFLNTMTTVTPGTSSQNIENVHTVTRTGGAAQTSVNTASVHDYAQRAGTGVESALLHDDAHALALAAELSRVYGSPADPVRDLGVINGDHDRLVQILSREVGDRVTVQETDGGTSGDYLIQQASHDVSQAGLVHTVSYMLTVHDTQSAFVLDTSLIDGTVPLIY